MKKLLLGLLFIFLLLIGVIFYNLYHFKPLIEETPAVEAISIDDEVQEHLVEAISLKTISYEEEELFDSLQFLAFNKFLAATYPVLHQEAQHRVINNYSHLYKIEGKNPELAPILLMAHHDVVPIASPALWTVHPFDHGITSDTLYGRGTLDDKGAVIAILEAVDLLLKDQFTPERTLYLAFGHDEEVGGSQGASAIAQFLKTQHDSLAFVLDEGGAITQGLVPGIDEETAVIGIAEKGMVSFELSILLSGGHSSKPEDESAIDVLAKAISTLKQHPFPKTMTPVLEQFLDEIGPHMSLINKVVMSNRWLFGSLILDQYEITAQGNAMIRTTTAPTLFNAGVKNNVIPTFASSVVNFRILPGETIESTKTFVENKINDPRISVKQVGIAFNPTPISPIDNAEFRTISQTIKSIYPETLTCPNLVIGATDARYFTKLSRNIYRFTPWKLSPKNINCFHGVDERITVPEFKNAIRFYRQLILNACQ